MDEPFAGCGFSDRTANALKTVGIDAPERLLFLTLAEICVIRGVGRVAMQEIIAYRGIGIALAGHGEHACRRGR